MAADIGQIINVLADVGGVFVRVSAVLGAVSFMNWFALFFGLIYIFRTISGKKMEDQNGESEPLNQVSEKKAATVGNVVSMIGSSSETNRDVINLGIKI